MFRMAWKQFHRRACSTRSVRRELIISQWTKRFSTERCNYCQENKPDRLPFHLVCDSQHNFSACVMSRGLLLRLHCISEWQNLSDNWLDFPRIDELRDLFEVFGVRMRRNTRTADSMFLELSRIRSCN